MTYRAFRRFVDRDLVRGSRPGTFSFLTTGVIWLPFVLVHQLLSDSVRAIALTGFVVATAAFFLFTCWRGWRLMRASAIRCDRTYDRQTKHILAREYAATDSATETRLRRKRGR